MSNFMKKVACPRRIGRVVPIIIGLLFIPYSLILSSSAHAEDTQVKEEHVYYYLHDHLGGIEAVTDENGTIVERRDYLPYGNERLRIEQDPQSGPQSVSDGPQSETYGFTGKELDEETGLYYYGSRYYDPTTARFTQIDPVVLGEAKSTDNGIEDILENPQLLNSYNYTANNPLKYVDEEGEFLAPLFNAILVLLFNPQTAYAPDEAMDTAIANGEIKSEPTHIVRDTFALVTGEKITAEIVNYGFKTVKELKIFRKLTGEGINPDAAAAQARSTTNKNIEGIKKDIKEFLGDGAKARKNDAQDLILQSKDEMREIRFDVNNPKPHTETHVHVKEFENTIKGKKEWYDRKAYPTGSNAD